MDAVGLGVALPVLPFFVMGLKATALQLAIVVSSNYIAQTFGKGARRKDGGRGGGVEGGAGRES